MDDRFLAEIELSLEKQTARKHSGPALEEHDPVVEALYLVGDDIRLLIKAMTKADIAFHPRPKGPLEVIAERKKLIGRAKLAGLIGQEVI